MKTATMKRIIAVGVLLGLALALIPLGQDATPLAKRKKKKKEYTGTFQDGVYIDNKYGFRIEIAEGWNVKMMEKGKSVRFMAEKTDYSIPPDFTENEYLTTAPMIKVFVDTSSLKVREFLDSLKSKSFSSKQKKAIYGSFKIFDGKTKRPIVTRFKLKNGLKGQRMKVLRRYRLEVPRGVGEVSDVVTDNVQGDLALFKSADGKHIIIISGICESRYYRGVIEPLFQSAFESFSFTDRQDSQKAE